ncbi:MAG: hypothetical protein E7401_03460 [Ruminococcaceae bacterium]|nr:hypothetical protein [Oscillospiraceae bacterium]
MATVNEKMTAIADDIREKTGGTDTLTLDDMAINIQGVYDSGRVDGYTEGYSEGETSGIETGRATENRAWWDIVTANNAKTYYEYGFSLADFNLIGGFNPPYKITPLVCGNMFRDTKGVERITDEMLDTSKSESVGYMFLRCVDLKSIETIDCSTAGSKQTFLFNGCTSLETIGRFILKEGALMSSYDIFSGCNALKNITFVGTINSSVSFQWSPLLTTESIENIISVLSDNASGQVLTFNKAIKQTYYNAHSSEYANADEAWDALCDTKPNWTISLV